MAINSLTEPILNDSVQRLRMRPRRRSICLGMLASLIGIVLGAGVMWIFLVTSSTLIPEPSSIPNFTVSIINKGADYLTFEYETTEPLQVSDTKFQLSEIFLPSERSYTLLYLNTSTEYQFIINNGFQKQTLTTRTTDSTRSDPPENMHLQRSGNLFTVSWESPKSLGGEAFVTYRWIIEHDNQTTVETKETSFEFNWTLQTEVQSLRLSGYVLTTNYISRPNQWLCYVSFQTDFLCTEESEAPLPQQIKFNQVSEETLFSYQISWESVLTTEIRWSDPRGDQRVISNSPYRFENLLPDYRYRFQLRTVEGLKYGDWVNYSNVTMETGNCGNYRDVTKILSRNSELIPQFTECTKRCVFHSLENCVTTCIKTKLELSENCSQCFGLNAQCGVSKCLLPCVTNPNSSKCVDCTVKNCKDIFIDCLKIPGSIMPQPTGK